MVHVVWHACCCLLLAGANVYVACSRPEASNSQEFVSSLSALVKIVLQQRGVLRRCRAQARHLLRPGLQCQHRVSWAAFAVPRGLHARAHHAARAALFACGRRLLPRQASHFLDVTGARVFWSCQTGHVCVCGWRGVCTSFL